ncbi:MAG: permease [Candidatus Aenigmatarchaeota archaeon]
MKIEKHRNKSKKGIHNFPDTCYSCYSEISIQTKKWYKDKFLLVLLFSIFLLVTAWFFESTKSFTISFIEYLAHIWWALLLGFFIGGIIDYYIPKEYIQKFFALHKKRTIFYSVIFGFLMSVCSHGVLAIAIELYRKGASTASVIAFLLASPWANLPITIILFGFFGLDAFYIIISSIIIALITGLIYQILDKKGFIECKSHKLKIDEKFSVRKDVKLRIKRYEFNHKNIPKEIKAILKGSLELTRMIGWWIIIGMLIASFASAFVPHEIFVSYLGPTILGLFVTLVIATIIEVCSEGSSPMAFEIYKQTGAFGNAFVFLNAGVATDYTEIGLLWSNIGKKTALLLPIITIPQILLIGCIFNIFL